MFVKAKAQGGDVLQGSYWCDVVELDENKYLLCLVQSVYSILHQLQSPWDVLVCSVGQ